MSYLLPTAIAANAVSMSRRTDNRMPQTQLLAAVGAVLRWLWRRLLALLRRS